MVNLKPLDPTAIEKTLLGVVQNWTDLFIEHRYAKKDRSGTPWVDHYPSEFYFLASKVRQVHMFGQPNDWLTLYVKPNPVIEPVVNARMTPPIDHGRIAHRNLIAAYQILSWPDYGHALVTANDYNSIANPWVCFIPLDAIPEINPANTPRFAPTDWPAWDRGNAD